MTNTEYEILALRAGSNGGRMRWDNIPSSIVYSIVYWQAAPAACGQTRQP